MGSVHHELGPVGVANGRNRGNIRQHTVISRRGYTHRFDIWVGFQGLGHVLGLDGPGDPLLGQPGAGEVVGSEV